MKLLNTGLLILTLLYSLTTNALTKDEFMSRLQEHYEDTSRIQHYTITFRKSSSFGPQSYDFNHPTKAYRQQTTDVDLAKQNFFTQTKRGGFPGGFLFETNEYQNDVQSVRYDVNGVLYGKQVFSRDEKAFEREVEEIDSIVGFFAVKPLIENSMKELKINFKDGKSKTIVSQFISPTSNSTKTISGSKIERIDYVFRNEPIQLLSIHHYSGDENQPFAELHYKNYSNINNFEIASQVEGKRFNRPFQYTIKNFAKISGIEDEKLKIPSGYGLVIERIANELSFEKITKDIYIIGNVNFDRNVLVKVNNNGLRVFGAPGSDKVSESVINLLEKFFPQKIIKSVYITHPHSDHIRGLRAYSNRNIPILADAYSIDAIKAFPGFKQDIGSFRFRTIKHKEVLEGMQFHIPKNSHAKGQSFVYFIDSKILYEGDFLEIPFDNTIASYMSTVEKEFVEYLRKEALKIERIVGHYRNGDISLEVMNNYYEANAISKIQSNNDVSNR